MVGDRDPEAFTPWRDAATVGWIDLKTVAETEETCRRIGPDPVEHRSYGGAAWLFGGFGHSWYNHILPPNSRTPDCEYGRGAFTARSLHAGGVNVSLVDGSARFAADAIDLAVWRALATRRLGEVTSSF